MTTEPQGWAFVKGHGTENDFVVLPDLDDALDLTPGLVAAICDRHAGVGGNGVLRLAPAPDGDADFFMDYRNADGSLAEMCGNGVRVLARYVVDAGVAPAGTLRLGTRGGVRVLDVPASGDITVDMGSWTAPDLGAPLVTTEHGTWPAVPVLVPNPHAVVFVDSLDQAGALHERPGIDPADAFPEGVNVEFVVERGPAHVAMRVHERGVGETRSCGTGACAVAVAARRRPGADPRETYRVDVPGGTLHVTERPDGTVRLTGPAVLVAAGELRADWLAAHR